MKKILVVTGVYLPGYKGGGPIKTIKNIVDTFGSKYKFFILTSDRDIGDVTGYPDIIKDQIISNNTHEIIYISPKNQRILFLSSILKGYYDVIYINSLFSKFSIMILLLIKLKLVKTDKIIIAPRGELASTALAFKSIKKKVYILISKWIQFYRDAFFQATSKSELENIKTVLGVDKEKTFLVKNLSGLSLYKNNSIKKKNSLSIIYLSRIHPIKNLEFIFKILSKLENINVLIDIYGPVEDEEYFNNCKKISDQLKENIKVNYKGSIPPPTVQKTICRYNLFFLPTLGENYGHTIVEALLTQTPVLISDQTPWNKITTLGAGKAINLKNSNEFVEYLVELSHLNQSSYDLLKKNVKSFAEEHINDMEEVKKYELMFE
jgi:glycosyltransferase involved in cell wall biosynthesis